jgi:hypothetical protein
MPVNSVDRRNPLPKHWLRCVRSAVLHAVSMANVAFTATQTRAENHFDPRTRLEATNDRLQRRVALLLEDLRIKDARMERLPAQRRLHGSPGDTHLEPAARKWGLGNGELFPARACSP